MAIRRRRLLPKIDLAPVDELIQARRAQHGGRRGAPPIVDGERVGAAINKSCILMLSALLQGYVEEVFVYASRSVLKNLEAPGALEDYRKTFERWGNPSSNNTRRVFQRIGIMDVFEGISWQRTNAVTVKRKLDQINTLRNIIAHGHALPRRISLAEVEGLRRFVETFAYRFGRHVRGKV